MAEISYPFNATNATTGATNVVSETQWQAMAHMWGGDRVDFQLTAASYSAATLPFRSTTVNVTTVQIAPGKAWVGGFYYNLTSALNVTIEANSTTSDRLDLIVIRADMSKPSVNLAVSKGVPAATPVAPQPVRQEGGIWELPLYEVRAPANGGTLVIASRAPYNAPPMVTYPFNAPDSLALLPVGSFGMDLDNNVNGVQTEMFRGRDGNISTRDLGKSRSYTPNLLYSNAPLQGQTLTRVGRNRWIAPNTMFYSMSITNPNQVDYTSDSGLAFTLPVNANGVTGQVFSGHLVNDDGRGGIPRYVLLNGRVAPGAATGTVRIYLPNTSSVANGMSSLAVFPGRSTITFSGVYEADLFVE